VFAFANELASSVCVGGRPADGAPLARNEESPLELSFCDPSDRRIGGPALWPEAHAMTRETPRCDDDTERGIMQARMTNPAIVLPDAMHALQALGKATQDCGVAPLTLELVNLRASQINACGVCTVNHPRLAKKLGETDDRLAAVAAWRDAPYFTAAERAALSLTEAVTRLSDRADPIPDAVWDEASLHYDERALAALVIAIANINVWNRLNVTTRQVAGTAW
jgi:AhpD family alkylhydroperoxidase